MSTSNPQAVRDRLRYDPPGSSPISGEARQALNKARPWILFSGVMLIIWAVLSAVMSIVFLVVDNADLGPQAQALRWLPLFYLLTALIYFLSASFLLQSASGLKAMNTGSLVSGLETFAKNQYSFWRLMGVVTIVAIVFIGVVVLGLFLMAMIAA